MSVESILRQKGSDVTTITPEASIRRAADWLRVKNIGSLVVDLGVPVVQPIAARIWEIQRRLHVRQPIKGYGILLETLPV